MTKKQKRSLWRILAAIALFVAGLFCKGYVRFALMLAAWAITGWPVVRKAFLNIRHGNVFDEHFLMTVATVGAFALGEYPEGAAVMIFFQIGELFESLAVERSRRSIGALMDLRPDVAFRCDGEEVEEVDPDDIQPGDLLLVKPGERIPVDGAVVEGSVCRGTVGAGASLFRAVTEKNSETGDWSSLASGCVLGEGARIGTHTEIRPGGRIWPDCTVGSGSIIRFNINSSGHTGPARFDRNAVIEGSLGCDITPQFAALFGCAAATACSGSVGCACGADAASQALLQALAGGIRSCGEKAVLLDSQFAAQSAFGALHGGYGLCVHIDRTQRGVCLQVFTGDGMGADASMRRRIENLLSSGDFRRAGEDEVGGMSKNGHIREAYIRSCLDYGRVSGTALSVGGSRSAGALSDVLLIMGAVVGHGEKQALFLPSDDGMSLRARDENMREYDDTHTMAAAFLFAAASHPGSEIACPDDAPEILSVIARSQGRELIRPWQDARARDMLTSQRYMYDGLHRAAFLAAVMSREKLSLAQIMSQVPDFGIYSRELPLRSSRAAFMRAAKKAGLGSGGSVRFEPGCGGEALRIMAQAQSAEAAQELCAAFCERARRLDTDIKRQKEER